MFVFNEEMEVGEREKYVEVLLFNEKKVFASFK